MKGILYRLRFQAALFASSLRHSLCLPSVGHAHIQVHVRLGHYTKPYMYMYSRTVLGLSRSALLRSRDEAGSTSTVATSGHERDSFGLLCTYLYLSFKQSNAFLEFILIASGA